MNKWQRRFFDLAALVAAWSKDPSSQVGAVIVDDRKRIVSVGFNGLPIGVHPILLCPKSRHASPYRIDRSCRSERHSDGSAFCRRVHDLRSPLSALFPVRRSYHSGGNQKSRCRRPPDSRKMAGKFHAVKNNPGRSRRRSRNRALPRKLKMLVNVRMENPQAFAHAFPDRLIRNHQHRILFILFGNDFHDFGR